MFKTTMISNSEFQIKLDTLVRSIAREGQAQVKTLIASIVNAGGTSEQALIEMALNRNLGPELRSNICWIVSRLQIPGAGALLKTLISDPSEQVREEAAAGLGLVSQDDDVVEVLLGALQRDRSKSVRLAVLHALGILSSSKSAVGLIKVLQDPKEDADVRADSAEALAHIKDAPVVDALIASLKDSSALVRYSAAYALGQQGDSSALPELRDLASRDLGTTPWGSIASCASRSIETITSQNQ
jgi:hypothetical protein